MSDFDLQAYQRDKIRRLEQMAFAHEQHIEQLERLLIVTLERQFHDTPVDPMAYLHHLAEIDLLCRDLNLDPIGIHRLAA